MRQCAVTHVVLVALASVGLACRGDPAQPISPLDAAPPPPERPDAASALDTAADTALLDAPPRVSTQSPLLFQLLDDLDGDGFGFVCAVGLCSWIPSRDLPGGERKAPVPARGASRRAWHLSTAPAAAGVEVRLDIHGPRFPAIPYPDLEAYAGVAFWARSDAPDQTLLVAAEDDKVLAPTYAEAANGPKPWFTRRVKLSAGWRRHIILFDDLQQVNAAGVVIAGGKLNTKAVWSFHFLAGLDGRAADAWIDDLALLCKGPCPPAPLDAGAPHTATALEDRDFEWTRSAASDPTLTCAEVAELATLRPDRWIAGPGERVVLRARIAGAPATVVPLWGWVVERLPAGTPVPFTIIDPDQSMIAVPVSEPGEYRIRTHTHYPTTQTCGSEFTARAGVDRP